MPREAQLVVAQSTGAVGGVGRMGTDAGDVGTSVVTLEYRRVSFLLVHQFCAFRRHSAVLCSWDTQREYMNSPNFFEQEGMFESAYSIQNIVTYNTKERYVFI